MATVKRVTSRRTRQGRTMVQVDVSDGASYLRCTFFNQPWRARQLSAGTDVVVFGKLERYNGVRQMTNPVVDLVGDRTGRIVPIYPQSDKAGLVDLGAGRLDRRGARSGPGSWSTRCPPSGAERLGPARTGPGP